MGQQHYGEKTVRCAVIVLNLNGEKFLPSCLDSIKNQTSQSFETVVVDNGSTDGSVPLVREKYPSAKILILGRNYGFSVAYNIALREAIARGVEYAILLNNDTFVAPGFVREMLKAVDEDPRIGAVCPKIYFAHQPTSFWYAGGDFSIWTARARHRGWKEVDQGQFDHRRDITLATGCAMLVRCSALREVGLLDEQFWAYVEDVEWSVRFLKVGYRLVFEPSARIWHCDGGTWVRTIGSGSQARRQYLSTRNMILLGRKHAQWWQLPTYLVGFSVNHIGFYTALRIWRRDFKALAAIYRGLWDGLRMYCSVKRWRREVDVEQV